MLERRAMTVASRPLALDGAAGPPLDEGADSGSSRVDAALVSRARTGDRAAEEQLYRAHAPGVLRLAARLLRSRDEAMDVLQDSFVAAFEELTDLRDDTAFRAWVQRIAVRLVHRRFRRRKLLALLGLGSTEAEVSLDTLADEAASPEARMELLWLDRALAHAPPAERIAWLLRHVEGLALDEVATACGCSLATVKRRIAAADARVEAHAADRETTGRKVTS
jgi:RNA polymerase sigma-70 factor, ECF subfamily